MRRGYVSSSMPSFCSRRYVMNPVMSLDIFQTGATSLWWRKWFTETGQIICNRFIHGRLYCSQSSTSNRPALLLLLFLLLLLLLLESSICKPSQFRAVTEVPSPASFTLSWRTHGRQTHAPQTQTHTRADRSRPRTADRPTHRRPRPTHGRPRSTHGGPKPTHVRPEPTLRASLSGTFL